MGGAATAATDRARASFLAVFAETCNVTAAAQAAGINRVTAYRWKAADEVFAAAWADAEEQAADALEQVAWERAKSGQSDRMLEILLKGHRPKYRDKQQVEHTGSVAVNHRLEAERELEEIFGPTPHLIEQRG